VLLAGVLLKLGTYGFLRFSCRWFRRARFTGPPSWLAGDRGHHLRSLVLLGPDGRQEARRVLVGLAPRLLHVGMFSLVPVGLSGSVLYMVNHGISTGASFSSSA